MISVPSFPPKISSVIISNFWRKALVLTGLGAALGSCDAVPHAGALVPALAAPTTEFLSAAALKIEPKVLRTLAAQPRMQVMILLSAQADLRAAYELADGRERGRFVYRQLTEIAAQTQGPVRQLLSQRGFSFQPFWVANVIAATIDEKTVQELAQRGDVQRIEASLELPWIEDEAIAQRTLTATHLLPAMAEWGVQNVRAPEVWDQGFSGQGVVVAGADTGISWEHPALRRQYRGTRGVSAVHDYSWHDAIHDSTGNPCGNDSQVPCDDGSHGTHTIGTVVGDDGVGNRVGVAPGAKWIGCRNMAKGMGTPARYSECFQFFIAPTDLSGNSPDPDQRPHVINNSWGCPTSEGCAPNTLKLIVENTQAAGIFVEASAGNSGPGCSSINDAPGMYGAAFSTGAIDSSNRLVGFSSRGPVTADGSLRSKPDLSAPGSRVRSSVPGGRYSLMSGTSMAGPHVVGVVALLWSARPEYVRQIAASQQLLRASANPSVSVRTEVCGGLSSDFVPNNSFGFGRVDAYEAVNW